LITYIPNSEKSKRKTLWEWVSSQRILIKRIIKKERIMNGTFHSLVFFINATMQHVECFFKLKRGAFALILRNKKAPGATFAQGLIGGGFKRMYLSNPPVSLFFISTKTPCLS
jgi:hypothetical protein